MCQHTCVGRATWGVRWLNAEPGHGAQANPGSGILPLVTPGLGVGVGGAHSS